jgi:hypothetical protein
VKNLKTCCCPDLLHLRQKKPDPSRATVSLRGQVSQDAVSLINDPISQAPELCAMLMKFLNSLRHLKREGVRQDFNLAPFSVDWMTWKERTQQ